MNKAEKMKLTRRIVWYFLGTLIYGFSVSLMTKASVGVSPIASVAYALTFIVPYMSLGTAQFIMNSLFVLVQAVWLGKEFKKVQYLQIVASMAFSLFIDATMPLAVLIGTVSDSFVWHMIMLCISVLLMGAGLSMMLVTNLIMLPGDGITQTMSKKLNWDFGQSKVVFDCLCVAVTCSLSLAVLHRIVGIQIGTVLAALSLGPVTHAMCKISDKYYR